MFLRSRFRLLYENDERLLFKMASALSERVNCNGVTSISSMLNFCHMTNMQLLEVLLLKLLLLDGNVQDTYFNIFTIKCWQMLAKFLSLS